MTSAVYERTANLGLGLIEFSFPNWADDANLNMRLIDAAMQLIGVSVGGAWQNSTPYANGDLIVDPDLGTLWRSNINHTSSPTGSFAEERANYPNYWIDASQTIHARGQWTQNTPYYVNDIVYNGYVWAMATSKHTSSSSFDQDIADGKLVVIVDNTAAVEDCEAAATVAMDSATSATASASTATTNANLATSAASAASASQAASATSATNADASEADAELAADRAEAALAAMLPDAPADNKYYARYNVTWQAVIAEAPTDGVTYNRKNSAWTPAIGGCVVADAPPTIRWNGMQWYESDTGNMYMWFDDGNSQQWVQTSGFAAYSFGAGGGIAEAPSDGHTYARKNTAWVDMGGAVPVNEAPSDGKSYVRKNGAWTELIFPAFPTIPMVFDTNGDAVVKFGATIVVRIKPTGLILTKDDVEVFSVSV